MFDLGGYLETHRQRIDDYLAERLHLVRADEHAELFDAIEYGLLSAGKRIRPILTIASAEAVGGDISAVMPFGCAIEMIHAHSLIHDDLPCMDDDELRRGQPTVHVKFGEALAVLAGDALLDMAFTLMTDVSVWSDIYHHEALAVIQEIAVAAGPRGMAGGQSLDLKYENRDIDEATLRLIHKGKTGALLRASVFAGAHLSGAVGAEMESLMSYAERIGLAFQIRDDLLNIDGDPEILGKAVGSDAEHGKATFPAVIGKEASETLLKELCTGAVDDLTLFSRSADPLRALAQYVGHRTH